MTANFVDIFNLNTGLSFNEFSFVSKKTIKKELVRQYDLLHEFKKEKNIAINNNDQKTINFCNSKISEIQNNIQLINSKTKLVNKQSAYTGFSKTFKWIIWSILIIYVLSLLILPGWMIITSFRDPVYMESSMSIFDPMVYLTPDHLFDNYVTAYQRIGININLVNNYRNYENMFGLPPIQYYFLNSLLGPKFTTSLWSMIGVSLIWSTFGPLINVFFTTLFAYILAKYRFPGRSFIYGLGIVIMIVPLVGTGPAGIMFNRFFGRQDDLFVSILTSPVTVFSGMNFLLMYAAFRSMPWDYAEAVFVDGGGHHQAFYKMYLPMVLPTAVVIFILSFIASWNDYSSFMISFPSTPNLAYGLYKISNVNESIDLPTTPEVIAGFVIALIPSVTLYLASQKLIMSKFNVGGLKG